MFRSLRENFVLKLASLIASISVWFYVNLDRSQPDRLITTTLFAEVQRQGQPPSNLLVRIRTRQVQVEVTGPRAQVESLRDNEIKALVNLSTARANASQIPIQGYTAPARAPSVTIRGLRQFVDAEVMPKQSRSMPIVPLFNNDPPFGMLYEAPRLDPTQARIIGSQEDLQKVARLVVFIQTKGGNVRADLPVLAQDKDGVLLEDVTVQPDTTHVELDLIEAPASRTLLVSAPLRGQPAPSYEITDVLVQPDQVTVTGRPDQLQPLTGLTTREVSVEGIRADLVVDQPLQLPLGVTVQGGRATVRVTVKVRSLPKPPPAEERRTPDREP